MGRIATMVSSSGLTLAVSFQPSSFASGFLTIPSQPTRFRSCTSNRRKWIGCVSTPFCVIFQICVPSVAETMGAALRNASMPIDRYGTSGISGGSHQVPVLVSQAAL
jgi:hypothetical protein